MSTRRLVLVGLAVSALVAGVLSFYASAHPDGLSQVAESLGFADTARDSVTSGVAAGRLRGLRRGRRPAVRAASRASSASPSPAC